ncbi:MULTISPECIES: VCBS repeat-containing protein [unclassified Streptomyces]|uniref:FG-GAP repeat domain-containing protein n=1 Tax=unclassified Streptomyces TaxID=2593676 RepID=UPI002E2B64DB|nr:VCBS repeat-containing protein [Streptomyces sp. NBC_00228]
MARHAFVAVATSAVLAAGLGPLLPAPAFAVGAAQETVVPATVRSTYTTVSLFNADTQGADAAGTKGVFHRLEGHAGLVWTRFSDGRSFDAPSVPVDVITRGTGGDVLSFRHSDGRVDLWDAVDGTTTTLQVPAGQTLYGVYGGTAVTNQDVTAEDGTVTKVKHLLTPGPDGTTRDVTVEGVPEGMTLAAPRNGDAAGLVFLAYSDDGYHFLDVDPETGRVADSTPAVPTGYTLSKISPERLVAYRGYNSTTALVFSRADLSAAPVEVTLDTDSSGEGRSVGLSVVGDWIVHRPGIGSRLTALPIAGGAPVTLIAASNSGVSIGPDGAAIVIGRTGADDWGVQHIQAGPDGRPTVTLVKPLPKPPYRIQGIALEQGRLAVADSSWGGVRDDYVRTVAATGTPTFGARSSYDGTDLLMGDCPGTEIGCSQLYGTDDDRAVWLSKFSAGYDRLTVSGSGQYDYWEHPVPAGGRITDVSGRYLIHTTTTAQTVYRIGDDGTPALTRTPGAAALSGDTLWTPGTVPGTLTAYNLTTKKTTETLTIDDGCAPTELRANGRWLYWGCADGTAGVYDRTAKKSVQVPSGDAELGDGFVVTHDRQAGQLVLTTVADGTPVSRVIGALSDTGVSQREVRWTVDRSTGNVAYVDDQERVHLVPTGVTLQPLRLLAPVDSASTLIARETDTTPSTLTTLLLSKPAAGWQLTVRSRATGKVVDTRTGGETRGEVKVGWSGTDAKGAFLTNGSYDWTLSVVPGDGVGAPVTASGTVRLLDAAPARHDHIGGGDAVGDLATLSSSGTLAFRQGSGKGTFFSSAGGSTGWTTADKVVSIGDLSGDRCNDVLVRLRTGALRAYKPTCDGTLKTSTAYTSLGTSGWNQYDVLTAPGDISGDGRPDLIARNASTGDVYLYKGTGTGTLSARVKLYADWKTYKKVVGVGDINGDGVGDLIAQDKANTLYRYYGTGRGTFGARAKLFTAWGGSYDTVVGVGDITGDGKADLVERDSAGVLYRNSGDGKGSFGARVKIATGWQGYRGIF